MKKPVARDKSRVGPCREGGQAAPVRLQKLMADAGIGSRRQLEGWIAQGEVLLNGQPAQLGDRGKAGDRLLVRGTGYQIKRDTRAGLPRVLAYHKPEGQLVTRSDPEGRATVFESIPAVAGGRWIAVGRLDINTSGLLLLTDQGELANRLMHPSREVEREYAVRILGAVTDEAVDRMLQGVELDDGPARFERIDDAGGVGANHWYHVVLREGRQREVRRLWEQVGLVVSRLIRIRYGSVLLPPRLRPGRWQFLDESQVRALLDQAGMPARATGSLVLQPLTSLRHGKPSRGAKRHPGKVHGARRRRG
jgi:23S rRNA pseudouridine2605 synthase